MPQGYITAIVFKRLPNGNYQTGEPYMEIVYEEMVKAVERWNSDHMKSTMSFNENGDVVLTEIVDL